MAANYRVVRYYIEGWRLAVAGPAGRKYVPIVVFDSGNLSLLKIPKDHERYFLKPAGKPWKCRLHRVVDVLLMAGRKYGMTQGAEEFLKEARK